MGAVGKSQLHYLDGGGEMGDIIRSYPWNKNPLGPVLDWPQSLQSILGILLHSAFPMFLFWGKTLTCFYNDAFRPSLGQDGKHPAIGKNGRDVWPEIWDFIGPLIQQVMDTGEPVYFEDKFVPFYRNGKIEDIYWTFSYSPAFADDGKINGVFVTCSETTKAVADAKKHKRSSAHFHNIILHAPVAMSLIRGPEYVIEVVNGRMAELWGRKTGEILNRPLFEARPEARGQGIEELLHKVYTTGETFSTEGFPIVLPRGNELKKVYMNFVYEAFREDDGSISGIVVVANEVTQQVLASKKLEESEKEFRILAESLPDLVWTTDARGAQTFASRRWKEFTGLDPYDETSFKAILHVDDYDRIIATWGTCLVTGQLYKAEARLKSYDGSYKWFYVVGEPVRDDQGAIERWIGAFTNIDERKKGEQRTLQAYLLIEESEKRFRMVADSAPAMIWMAGTDKLCNFFSKAWLDFTGRSMTAEIGNGWTFGVYPDDLQPCLNQYIAAFDKRESFYVEYRLKRKDGEYRWISNKAAPRFNADNVFEGYIGACMDIHDKIIAQNKIKENEERLNIIINASELGIWEWDMVKDLITYSDRYLAIFGHKKGSFLPHDQFIKQLYPDDVEVRNKAVAEAKITGNLYYRMRIFWEDKSVHWIEVKGQVFHDEDGSPLKLLGTIGDITEECNNRISLEESERKFRQLADFMPQFIWTSDAQGNINYYNQAVLDYSGYNLSRLYKEGIAGMMYTGDNNDYVRKWKNSIDTGNEFWMEHRLRKHDGAYRWHFSRAFAQRDREGNIQMWVGTSTDIQDQKMFRIELEKQVTQRTAELNQMNEALKKSEERYHLMVDEVQDYAILYLNIEGTIENWNKGAEHIKGYKTEEIVGKNFSIFYTETDKQSHLPEKLLAEARRNGKAAHEGWRARKDGSLFWGNIVITALHDEKNDVVGFSKVTRDLTNKKEADDKLKLGAEQLALKNKELEKMNAELESFAYVSSHDLQEPLRKIQTFASLIIAKEAANLSEKGMDYFRRMQNAAGRMQSLIEDLLAYSRTGSAEGQREEVDLNDIIADIKNELKESLEEKNGVIETNSLCRLNVIPYQFRQMMMNLLTNALKFSKPGVPPLIKIESEIIQGDTAGIELPLPENNYCHLRIADNGIGFDQQYSERIFEVFQRLHGREEYKGTGIGLSIVKKIVENHRGVLRATGQLGKGASFDIYLPVL